MKILRAFAGAYLTIEASIIIPLILFWFSTFISFSVYELKRCTDSQKKYFNYIYSERFTESDEEYSGIIFNRINGITHKTEEGYWVINPLYDLYRY